MLEILNKIGEVSGVLGDFRTEVIKTLEDIASKKQELDLVKIEQDTKQKDLDAREAEIKKIEDISTLYNNAKAALKEVENKTAELLTRETDFAENVFKQKKELNELALNCKHEQELIAQEHAILNKREEKIEENLANRVKAVIANMKKT